MLASKFVEIGYAITSDGKLSKTSRSGRITYHSVQSLQNELGGEWVNFCLDYIAQFPIPVKLAFGDDTHEVFEKYRPGSCMRYSEKRDMREVYANNPDKVCCAYAIKGEHELLCSSFSAIVWTGKKNNYIDRIYSQGSPFADAIQSFADAIAMAITAHNSLPVKTVYSGLTRIPSAGKVTFTLRHNSDEPLPYMDSVNVITEHTDSTVTLSTDGDGDVCQDQDGTYPNGDCSERYRCENCRERVNENYMRMDDGGLCYCESCYDELFSHCEWTKENYPAEDVSYVTIYASSGTNYRYDGAIRQLMIADDVLRCEFTRCDGDSCDWVHDDDKIEVDTGDVISPADMEDGEYIELSDGTVTASENAICCVDNDEWVLTEDAHQWEDGEFRSYPEPDTELENEIKENGVPAVPILFLPNGSAEIVASANNFVLHRVPGEKSKFDVSHVGSKLSAQILADDIELAKRKFEIFTRNMSAESRHYFAGPIDEKIPGHILNGILPGRRKALAIV